MQFLNFRKKYFNKQPISDEMRTQFLFKWDDTGYESFPIFLFIFISHFIHLIGSAVFMFPWQSIDIYLLNNIIVPIEIESSLTVRY